jgi:hypothetical protein
MRLPICPAGAALKTTSKPVGCRRLNIARASHVLTTSAAVLTRRPARCISYLGMQIVDNLGVGE